MLFLFTVLLSLNLSVLPVNKVSNIVDPAREFSRIDLAEYKDLPLSLPEMPQESIKQATKNEVKNRPVAVGPAELEVLWDKYSQQYGVDKTIMKEIARCESNFNSRAVNSSYGGMYQFSVGTWSANRKDMGLDPNPELRFNAEESIKTTAYKISRDGTGAWPVCGKKV
jgi:soluble lytic murein transglycosylase-like protein